MRGAALIPTEDMVEAKKVELAKLDRIERHLLGVMTRDHVRVDHGHVVMDEGSPCQTTAPVSKPRSVFSASRNGERDCAGLTSRPSFASELSPRTWWTLRSGG